MSGLSEIAWLSVRVSGLAVLISAVVGVPVGAWLGLARFRGKALVVAAVHTGMALPPVVVGLLLFVLLSSSGPLAALNWLFTPRAMVAAQTILALPFVVGITCNAVASISPDFVLQVRAMGASRWQTRWTLLREARAGVALAVAAAFGRSISEVGAVLIVGGNIQGHTRVLTTAIVLETGKGHFQFALALGAVLLSLAVLVNLIILRMQRGRLLA
jgi:tungstate transport system permease protein